MRRRFVNKRKRRKKKIILYLVFLILFLGVAYSNFGASLDIDGLLNLKSRASFSTDSWERIINNVRNGRVNVYSVGDTKEIDLGELGVHTLRVANNSSPSECNGEDFSRTACGFVLEFADSIILREMNQASTNLGGYPLSSLRNFINFDVFYALPEVLQKGIADTYTISGKGSEDPGNFISSDKLYLLSSVEVFGANTQNDNVTVSQTRQLDYYRDIATSDTSRTKKNGSTVTSWWLRSSGAASNVNYRYVSDVGWPNATSAPTALGVSPAFRIAPSSFDSDSWEEIVSNVKTGNIDNYPVGSVKVVELPTLGNHLIRVSNTSTPNECSGSNYSQTACGFVLEFADIITTAKMNNTASNAGGWPSSIMRDYANNTLFNELPSALRDGIILTSVISGHEKDVTNNYLSVDNLYLLSYVEIFGSELAADSLGLSQTRQLDYYSNKNVTSSSFSPVIKKLNSTNSDWWLRAPGALGKNAYRRILNTGTGEGDGYAANNNSGVTVAFRLSGTSSTVHTITLDNQGASVSGTTEIYQEYNSRYYLNNSVTSVMSTSSNGINIPKICGSSFGGYYTEKNGSGTQIINANGYLVSDSGLATFTEATTLYANWITTSNVITDSWDTIINNVQNGNTSSYHVGDVKEVELGNDLGVQCLRVANTSTPSECSTTGFSQTACGFVLEFADIITTHRMNSTDTNVGGWPESSMRDYLNNENDSTSIYNSLPAVIKDAIINTTVVSGHGSTVGEANFTSTDKLYLLSTKEVWGKAGATDVIIYDSAETETRQLDYYANQGETTSNYAGAIKQYNSSNYPWWLRSANSNNTNNFFIVTSYGACRSFDAVSTYGVAPAFRLAGPAAYTLRTVTLNYQDNAIANQEHNVISGSSMILPTPTREGYTFNGWYTASTGGVKVGDGGDSYTPSANITLYAQWMIEEPAIPTISGGSTKVYNYSDTTLNCSTTTTYPSGITLYYSFGYSSSDGGTPSNWTSASTSSTYSVSATAYRGTRYYSCRVYASDGTLSSSTSTSLTSADTEMSLVNARIYFNANGGSDSASRYVQYGSTNIYSTRTETTSSSIPTVTKTGYTFNGWYTASSGGTQVISASGTVQASVSEWTNSSRQWIRTNTTDSSSANQLYAQWVDSCPTVATSNFSTDSWTTVISNIKSGNISRYNLGDEKTIELRNNLGCHKVRIANTSTPAECSTAGFSQAACGFVLEFADIITNHRMNPYDSSSTAVGNGNIGGWPASEMRTYLNSTSDTTSIYNSLPTVIKDAIVDTAVVSGHGSTSGEANFTSTDKLYLLSTHEVFEDVDGNTSSGIDRYDTAYNNTRQLDYYANQGVTTSNYAGAIKQYNGSNSTWWLRSAYSSFTNNFFTVYGDDGWRGSNASHAYGVAPAFRIA